MRYATLLIAAFVFISASPAEEIYTWRDSKGVTHISPTPPPPNARDKEVIEYTPRSSAETEAIRQERQAAQGRHDREAILQNARDARREATAARERAAEAKAAADAAEKKAVEFKKKVGNTIRRQQLNRGTVLQLEADALAAREKALSAAQNADSAEKRADAAEKKARDVLGRSITGNTGEKPASTPAVQQHNLGQSRP
ncbi:MAG: DUF4124 domain-containing protein [Desulfobacterales bacterium]